MTDITIREMEQNEASLAREIGRPSFEMLEGLVFKKPKRAFLAIMDGQIAGMAAYEIFTVKNNQKIGYVETAYVKKGCEGKGIGSRLYKKVSDFLIAEGCEIVAATIKDDNVASWKLIENNGCCITSFSQIIKRCGIIDALKLWFNFELAVATGFNLWTNIPAKNTSGVKQMGIYAFLNLLVLCSILLISVDITEVLPITAAVVAVLGASLLGGFTAVLLTKEKWCFRAAEGGLLISVIVTLMGGVWPIIGRFYPVQYKHTKEFNTALGLEGLFEWLAILLIVLAAYIINVQSEFWHYIIACGSSLLLYHSIPIYPFECFGGKRIWNYSKVLSALTVAVSLALVFLR